MDRIPTKEASKFSFSDIVVDEFYLFYLTTNCDSYEITKIEYVFSVRTFN